jgi:hypothetical protein
VRDHDAATVLTRPQWTGLEAAHHERVDALRRGHLDPRPTWEEAPGRGLPLHLLLPAPRSCGCYADDHAVSLQAGTGLMQAFTNLT